MERNHRFNPVVVAAIVAICVFVWNAIVTAGAWALENYVQTWAGFILLAVGVLLLGPVTAAVAASARPRNGCIWGIGIGIAVFVWNAIVTAGAWALENYVQTWAGFILLAVGIMVLGPLTAAAAAYFLANRAPAEEEETTYRRREFTPEPGTRRTTVVEEEETTTRREPAL